MTKRKKDMDRYKRLKQKVQWEIRQANKKYMEEVSTDYKDNSKKFRSMFQKSGVFILQPRSSTRRWLMSDD
jgi:TRAP-type C4-dicarboxylate transport system substrate-binding protein